jgi:endo-1,4-beta-xylanase
MLAFFGNTQNSIGVNYYFMTAARLDSVSRTAISCNNTSTPWSAETGVNGTEYDDGKLHHMVSTLTNDSIKLYIDGTLTGAKQLDTNNNISRISRAFAYLAKSGYTGDLQWIGRIHEFNIYNKVLDSSEVRFLFHKGVFTLPGNDTVIVKDTVNIWKGPALATGMPKFLGSAGDAPANDFANYWTQLTPENAGKWGSVGTSTDTTQWNWSGLDNDYTYAKNHGMIFKDHNLIWGQQQPSWISGLDSAQQLSYITTWMRMVGQRYPDMAMIDVVNEPLYGHNPPDGGGRRANYKNALGGTGTTGWDWLIKSFQLARLYIPHAKLLINDYGIINSDANTTSYIQIIGLLKDRGLIDGIGEQGHGFESVSAATIQSNLDRLAALGLPIYITEFDLNIQDDNQQTTKYQELFPVLWQHPAVKGITLWGYIQGKTWVPYSYLVNTDGTARPALFWLAQYVKNNPTGVKEIASVLPTSYNLEQNYPNPFNPSTTIQYSITHTTNVTLKVFDMLGREVQTLVNTQQAPGQYSVTLKAQNLGSGVYFYRINAGTFTETKKLMLLK